MLIRANVVAWRGLVTMVAGSPLGSPDFVSNANVRMTRIFLAGSARSERGSRPLPKHPRALRTGMRLIRDNTRNAANPSSFR